MSERSADLRSDETRFWHVQIEKAVALERERCATVALKQRCERGTPWDRACVAIANAIRGGHA